MNKLLAIDYTSHFKRSDNSDGEHDLEGSDGWRTISGFFNVTEDGTFKAKFYRGSADMGRLFDPGYTENEITVTFDVLIPTNVELNEFMVFNNGGGGIDITPPPSDGRWHTLQARFNPTGEQKNRTFFRMTTSVPDEGKYVEYKSIHITQD